MSSEQSQPKSFFGDKLTMRQFVTRSIVAMVAAAVGWLGLGAAMNQPGTTPNKSAEVKAMSVETISVEFVDSFIQRRTFTGVLKASRTSELGFERTGRLVSVAVGEGDRVEQDQRLAKLDTANLEAKQRELTAQRAAAASVLKELEAGPRQQTIAAAKAEVRDLQSQVELAELIFKRREQLLNSKAISQEEYDQNSLGLKSLGAKLDAAERRLDELEAGTRAEQLEAQRAVVAQLDGALANVAVNIEESTLLAPFSGQIGKRYLDEGTIVAPGQPLLRVVEDDQLEAWIGLPAALAAKLKPDEQVDLVVQQSQHEAKVKAILPELDPATRTRTAIFLLELNGTVFPAQVVRIEIEQEAQADGFWVPSTALARSSRGLWSVLVAQPNEQGQDITVKRDIEVLHTDGERVLVRGTLQPGDRVIISGTHRIVAGQPVIANQLLSSPLAATLSPATEE